MKHNRLQNKIAGSVFALPFCVVAATATPYKFPETCERAFGANRLTNPPASFAALETAPITQTTVVDVAGIDDAVRARF